MSQTREQRIYLMWKAVRKRYDYVKGYPPRPLMQVARRFSLPVSEVREIIDAQRASRA